MTDSTEDRPSELPAGAFARQDEGDELAFYRAYAEVIGHGINAH